MMREDNRRISFEGAQIDPIHRRRFGGMIEVGESSKLSMASKESHVVRAPPPRIFHSMVARMQGVLLNNLENHNSALLVNARLHLNGEFLEEQGTCEADWGLVDNGREIMMSDSPFGEMEKESGDYRSFYVSIVDTVKHGHRYDSSLAVVMAPAQE